MDKYVAFDDNVIIIKCIVVVIVKYVVAVDFDIKVVRTVGVQLRSSKIQTACFLSSLSTNSKLRFNNW